MCHLESDRDMTTGSENDPLGLLLKTKARMRMMKAENMTMRVTMLHNEEKNKHTEENSIGSLQ